MGETNFANHIITCNYCGKQQIVVHNRSNCDHNFDTIRQQTANEIANYIEDLDEVNARYFADAIRKRYEKDEVTG